MYYTVIYTHMDRQRTCMHTFTYLYLHIYMLCVYIYVNLYLYASEALERVICLEKVCHDLSLRRLQAFAAWVCPTPSFVRAL